MDTRTASNSFPIFRIVLAMFMVVTSVTLIYKTGVYMYISGLIEGPDLAAFSGLFILLYVAALNRFEIHKLRDRIEKLEAENNS